MITLTRLALGMFCLSCLCLAPAGQECSELLIKWADPADPLLALQTHRKLASTVLRDFTAIGWQLVGLAEGVRGEDAIAFYRSAPGVIGLQPNNRVPVLTPPPEPNQENGPGSILRAFSVNSDGALPNDPRFKDQWNLKKIGLTNVWQTTTGSRDVVVAVIDTGINYNHEDIKENLWRNPGEAGMDANGKDKASNGVDDDGNGYVDDLYGIDTLSHDSDPMDGAGVTTPFHGTGAASVIGAVGNNGKGLSGVNWNVSLLGIRAIGVETTLASLLEAYEYVLMMKARGVNIRVANYSFTYGSFADPALKDAHEAMGRAGILQVNGAANDQFNLETWPLYPAAWRTPSMIVVGGTDQSDNLASFSNYGSNIVDLAAPAVSIPVARGPASNTYGIADGNSLATPQVAGAAALLLAARPNLTIDQLKAALFASIDIIPSLRGKLGTGGRLNIRRALEYLAEPAPTAIVVTATPRGQRTSPLEPVQVVFNRAMNRQSVEGAISIAPALNGSLEWSADSTSFVLRHESPFDSATNYTVRILGSAQDAAGGTLDGNYNRSSEGSPSDDFVWKFSFATLNDDFATPQVLTGPAGVIQGNNRRASIESFEEIRLFPPEWQTLGSTLWYAWRAPSGAGWVSFDLGGGTAFDSLLLAFTGEELNQLVPVARNDNLGSRLASRISFATLPGSEYRLVVATRFDIDPAQVGNISLSWYPTPSPGFTGTQFSPATGTLGAKVTLTGTNFTGATAVLFNGASATFTNALTNNLDLRITATVPPDATSGPITILTPHGNVTSTAVFKVLPPTLSLSQTSAAELSLTWAGTRLALEYSTDLRSWQQLAPPGPTNATIRIQDEYHFFRLRRDE